MFLKRLIRFTAFPCDHLSPPVTTPVSERQALAICRGLGWGCGGGGPRSTSQPSCYQSRLRGGETEACSDHSVGGWLCPCSLPQDGKLIHQSSKQETSEFVCANPAHHPRTSNFTAGQAEFEDKKARPPKGAPGSRSAVPVPHPSPLFSSSRGRPHPGQTRLGVEAWPHAEVTHASVGGSRGGGGGVPG